MQPKYEYLCGGRGSKNSPRDLEADAFTTTYNKYDLKVSTWHTCVQAKRKETVLPLRVLIG
jgi:hypothetical protein